MTFSRLAAALVLAALVSGTSRAEWTGGANSEVPIEGNGSAWLVRATLNGNVSCTFMIDTGATLCVLGPGTARRLNLTPTGEQVELRTANGVVQAPVVHLRTLDVGGNRARDVTAVVHGAVGAPLDGIIGLSYLNNFRYSIDPRRRILRLQ
jgi:clan AA aspartic protease (TIGR02281 family)